MNNVDTNDQLEVHELSEGTQLELLLTYLTSHKMSYIQNFLRGRGLPYSYRKEELPRRITTYLSHNQIDLVDLVNLLNTIEGWGKQHVYLYRAPVQLSRKWRNFEFIQRQLEAAGYLDRLNQSRPLILPPQPTLSTIDVTQKQRVRVIWVERRTWRVRVPDQDRIEASRNGETPNELFQDQIVWQAYRVRMARGLIVFEWDLNTSDAMLLIQQLPSGRNYKAVRDEFESYLRHFLPIDTFEKVRVSSGLSEMENCGEIRRHHLTFRSTENRGRIAVTSPGKDHDVFDHDSVINRARAALGADASGLLGHFYWMPLSGRPSVEVYTQIYGEDDDDQRVGILAEHKEEDVRHVLSRIRHHCV